MWEGGRAHGVRGHEGPELAGALARAVRQASEGQGRHAGCRYTSNTHPAQFSKATRCLSRSWPVRTRLSYQPDHICFHIPSHFLKSPEAQLNEKLRAFINVKPTNNLCLT